MGASDTKRDAYRHLPSVEEVLHLPEVRALEERLGGQLGGRGRELVTGFVRAELDAWRAEIGRGELTGEGVEARLAAGALTDAVSTRVRREEVAGLTPTVNATGVVLHTGLGRAPVHPEASAAMAEAARRYSFLEVDRVSGERSQRDDRLSELCARLVGSESAIAVNNCAAAVLLCLNELAGGRETILSRGELVEIGGSFRMPDVMERAGTRLVEVGTTNRTRRADYERAISDGTGLLLKVHTSNYRVQGFTEEVDVPGLAEIGRAHGVPTVYDLGSGLLEDETLRPLDMLEGEPLVREAVAGGVDVVLFSGDKLLGGPQAGFLVGSRERVSQLRSNPMYRALRLDKVALAGLERTLELVLEGRGDEIPSRALMLRPAEELEREARELGGELASLADLRADVREGRSQPGSGSAPGVFLDTFVVRVRHASLSAAALAERLRVGEPPVFARIQDDAILLDPRTMLGAEDRRRVVDAFRALASG